MRLVISPFTSLSGIISGNPYKDPLTISAGQSLLEIASNFPNHSVFVKAPGISRFVTSELVGGGIHVYYDDAGRCTGVEINRSKPIEAIACRDTPLTDGTLGDVLGRLTAGGMPFRMDGSGIEVPKLGISLWSEEFSATLNCRVDSVYAELRCS